MEQLIKITTVPIQYEMKINDAKLQRRNGTAEVEISRQEGGLQIKSRPIQLQMDTFDARNSITPTTRTAISQAADAGTHAAYSATAQFASEGKMLLKAKVGSEALSQMFANRAAQPDGTQVGIEFLPTVGPNIDWIPPELSIQYDMDKLMFDAKIDSGNVEFIPGSIELVINQHPEVQIEYIGDPIYVPPSSADRFLSGEIIDTQA